MTEAETTKLRKLRREGRTFSDIATRLGYSAGYLWQVYNRTTPVKKRKPN